MAGTATSTPVAFGARWKLRISAVWWFLLLAGFLLGLPVLLDVSWLVVAGLLAVALLVGLVLAWLVRLAFRGQRQQPFVVSYLKAALATLFIFGIVVALPIYYAAVLTELKPLTVPQATLSNGKQTVVFQGMMHVGSEPFYKGVVYDLEKALSEGYVIYYEGVQNSPEGDTWFNDTLAGGGDLSANYKMLSDVCGLKFQLDYFQLLRADMTAHPERHVAADVSTADMMHEYQRLVAADPGFAARVQPAKADAAATASSSEGLSGLIGLLDGGTAEQKRLAGYACRGFLTWTLGRPDAPSPLDPVILDYRNKALADRISTDTRPLIYITYGAGHLPGLLQDLKAIDPAWEIQSVKWQRVVEAPDDVSGRLSS
ncbi:hypothetical protein [Devosia sp. A16]|uniref:hypothetical protein n=1 Tax=Devosia sp. A16 TaxID=1736675 RepID=UPI0006D7E4BB|nr:hypothetical protein [Devosia sp. A16]